jgi:hypothetical protein
MICMTSCGFVSGDCVLFYLIFFYFAWSVFCMWRWAKCIPFILYLHRVLLLLFWNFTDAVSVTLRREMQFTVCWNSGNAFLRLNWVFSTPYRFGFFLDAGQMILIRRLRRLSTFIKFFLNVAWSLFYMSRWAKCIPFIWYLHCVLLLLFGNVTDAVSVTVQREIQHNLRTVGTPIMHFLV